jgi:hypothetical protein
MAEGVDYAFDRPTVSGLVAARKTFACRYVGPGSSGKHLTRGEAEALSAAGIAIVANAEGAADGLLGGFDIGQDWALSAHQQGVACGMPATAPIYLSVDFDVTSTQWPAVRRALQGAASVIGRGRVGVYGGYNAVAWSIRDAVAEWFWQTRTWSGGRWHSLAHIQQYRLGVSLAGGTVDLDRSTADRFGQWRIGEVDVAEVYYRIRSSDPAWNGKTFVSNRIHRRQLRSPGEIQRAATAGATLVTLTDQDRHGVSSTETWEDFVTAVAGPVFPDLEAQSAGDHTHTVTLSGATAHATSP